jgi:hypothetical protein
VEEDPQADYVHDGQTKLRQMKREKKETGGW